MRSLPRTCAAPAGPAPSLVPVACSSTPARRPRRLGAFADDAAAQRRHRPWRADEAKFDTLLQRRRAATTTTCRSSSSSTTTATPTRRSAPRAAARSAGCRGCAAARRGCPSGCCASWPAAATSSASTSTARSRRLLGREAITVGAKTVQALMGYDGKGVGVAVIDSGVTPNHDDLRYAGSTAQRVTKFVDFVNGQHRPLRRLGPRHARRRHHRRQRLRLARHPRRHRPGGHAGRAQGARRRGQGPHQLRSSRRSTGRWPTAPPTTSASSTCRSARACSSPTTPTRSPWPPSAPSTPASSWSPPPATSACNANGDPQYGAITAPGQRAVGAHRRRVERQRHGPAQRRHHGAVQLARADRCIDFIAKPDVVAPGTGVVSLVEPGQQDVRREGAVPRQRLALDRPTSRTSR